MTHTPSAADRVHNAVCRRGVDQSATWGKVVDGFGVGCCAVVNRETKVVYRGIGSCDQGDFDQVSERNLDVRVGCKHFKTGQNEGFYVAVFVGDVDLEVVVTSPTGGLGGDHVNQQWACIGCGVPPFKLDAVQAVADGWNGDVWNDLGHLLDVEHALTLAPIVIGDQNTERTRGHSDGGVAEFGCGNDYFSTRSVPIAVPFVLDEGIHVGVADGHDCGIITTNGVGFNANVRKEVQALIDKKVLRSRATDIQGGGYAKRAAEGICALCFKASERPEVTVEIVVAGDGGFLS